MKTVFDAKEKRILELPQLTTEDDMNSAEYKALLKIIDNMPFVLELAEYNYDQHIADILIMREYKIMAIYDETKAMISNYLNSKDAK